MEIDLNQEIIHVYLDYENDKVYSADQYEEFIADKKGWVLESWLGYPDMGVHVPGGHECITVASKCGNVGQSSAVRLYLQLTGRM